jgi:adenylosuccinate lyase
MMGMMLASMKYVLAGLTVNVKGMRENLDLLGGYLLSERVMFELAGKVGKQSAHELVQEAAMHGIAHGLTLEQALRAAPGFAGAMDAAELARVLDPTTYVGMAPRIVDRVLARARAEGWLDA